MEEKIEKVIHLIEASDLDSTIKEILIRDLKADGLTDFLREQIEAYCVEGLKKLDAQIAAAKKILEERNKNPA